MNRRDVLKAGAGVGMAALLDIFPPSIRRALALPAASPTGTIQDVQHVVILMMENRSFDHYFGTLGGVRGFNDRQTAPLRNGRSIWEQPDGEGGVILPFSMPSKQTASQSIQSLPHGWVDGHAAWAGGRYDNWIPAKGVMTMGHYTREDIPFHFALADAFTVCDAYFCSLPGATNPNRSHLMTGTIDPFGTHGGPMKDQPPEGRDYQPRNGPPVWYTTYPERLQAAGVSWKIYQGIERDGPFPIDPQDEIRRRHEPNPGDPTASVSCFNVLRFFKQFAELPEDSPLYQNAMTHRPPSVFAEDAKAGRLPQVSWIMPPLKCSEHPMETPADGANFISFVLDSLTSNPQTWSKTVFLVMYDENDGFFDHVLPPMPPANRQEGASNVDVSADINAKDGLPFGLGARVPLLAISPWSKGGVVCSQVFDHTSVIQFLETRFGVKEPNISPWRRAVCGDLTSVFDFRKSDLSVPPMPDARALALESVAQARTPAPHPPRKPRLHKQESTQRITRALPYALHVQPGLNEASQLLDLAFVNAGSVAAVFHVFDHHADAPPKRYTVAAGTRLADAWPLTGRGSYDLEVLGPNGFLRRFTGQGMAATSQHGLSVQSEYLTDTGDLRLVISNLTRAPRTLIVTDNAYGQATRHYRVPANARTEVHWELAASDAWYDLTLATERPADFSWRYAGHVETGRLSKTDPVLGHAADSPPSRT